MTKATRATVFGRVLTEFSPYAFADKIFGDEPNIHCIKDLAPEVVSEFKDWKSLKSFSVFYMGDIPEFSSLTFSGRWSGDREEEKCEFFEINKNILAIVGFSRPLQIQFFYRDGFREETEKMALNFAVKYKIETKKESSHKIYLLFQNSRGEFYLNDYDIDKDFVCDVGLNYGQDFVPVYERFKKSLIEEKSGIYILTSQPGCGKTSLLKFLIRELEEKKVVFLPPNMVGAFSNPAFLPFIAKQEVDIVLMEDAETALKSRDEGATGVSALLNLTDGILGDILKIKVLATMNTGIDSIDAALTRPGRIKFYHSFGKLNIEDSDRLLEHLEKPKQGKSMSVAEIYNFGAETGFKKKEKGTMNLFAQK